MRILYLIAGVFLGLHIASVRGIEMVEYLNKEYDKQFLAASLTGYYEGWTRGRDYTEAKMIYFLDDYCPQYKHNRKLYEKNK